MRVFVTGGTGFIGHYVVKALLEKGHDVVIATRHPNKMPSLRSNEKVSFVEASLTDFDKLGEGLAGLGRYSGCHPHERYPCYGGSPRDGC